MTPPQAPPPPAPKKSNVLLWVILGVGGLFMMVAIGVIATGFFVAHKVKQVAGDISANPAMAITKMMAATNPDIEVLNYDDKTGMIRMKDKRTGKVMEVNFEDAKNGNFTVKEEGGKEATLSIAGQGGNRPDWVPVFPGAKQTGNFSSMAPEGASGTLSFTADAAPKDVADFYREKLKAEGFGIAGEFSGGDQQATMLTAENKEKNRSVHVVIGGEGKSSTIGVTFTEKKGQ